VNLPSVRNSTRLITDVVTGKLDVAQRQRVYPRCRGGPSVRLEIAKIRMMRSKTHEIEEVAADNGLFAVQPKNLPYRDIDRLASIIATTSVVLCEMSSAAARARR